jgi:hypothetical protein
VLIEKMKFNLNKLPIYGGLTGFTLPTESFELLPGLTLQQTFVDTFGARMMAFAPPKQGEAHPAPWAAVSGGSSFECRVQLCIMDGGTPDGFSPNMTAWLVAALLRLWLNAPIRMAVLANMPFKSMAERGVQVEAVAYESAVTQWGVFTAETLEATATQLEQVRKHLPVAARLFHDDRFQRAFSIYDEALWSPRKEHTTVLIWTALEVLFGVSAEQNKTRAICESVSSWLGADSADRDRAYNTIRDLYQKRGRIVHVGRQLDDKDFVQSLLIARAAFGNLLNRNELPPLRTRTIH